MLPSRKETEDDTLYVYLRSHGCVLSGGSSYGIVAPDGSRWSFRSILSIVLEAQVKNIVFFVDSCYSAKMCEEVRSRTKDLLSGGFNVLVIASAVESTKQPETRREVEFEGEKYLMMRQSDVLAVIEK